MKSIQERLREPILGNAYEPKQLLAERQEAANVIDGLAAEREQFRAALQMVADGEYEFSTTAQAIALEALAAVKANTEGEL